MFTPAMAWNWTNRLNYSSNNFAISTRSQAGDGQSSPVYCCAVVAA